jgi:trehalose/maltose hydrolase-like predicted phosphorylase
MIAQRISSDRGIGILERGAGDWHVATRRIDPTTYERFAWLDGATATTYADIFAMSKRRLRRPTDMDIVIDGPPEDQEAIRSFLYYLRISGNPILPPMGLSSARYGGFRFWDAEAWMLPVYCFTNPDVAKLATAWRRENSGDHFAWEAGPAGQDETPPEFTGAIHVAGWAVWWSRRAEAFGLATAADTEGLARIALKQFQEHAAATDRGIEIRSVESPDEGRLRNNDLVTNLLAKMVAELCGEREWAGRVVIPTAADGVPQTFDNDHMRTYQQAAALLSLFPLEWPFDARTQKAMFKRYNDKATENGPAMSDAVHAVIAARLGLPEEAYRLWRRAWQPFLDDRMQFRERRSSQEGYFVTGAAGCIESVLYGFAGIKVVRGPGAIPLKNGYSLSIRPRLPPAWKSLTIENLQTPSGAFRIAIRGGELSVSRAK